MITTIITIWNEYTNLSVRRHLASSIASYYESFLHVREISIYTYRIILFARGGQLTRGRNKCWVKFLEQHVWNLHEWYYICQTVSFICWTYIDWMLLQESFETLEILYSTANRYIWQFLHVTDVKHNLSIIFNICYFLLIFNILFNLSKYLYLLIFNIFSILNI